MERKIRSQAIKHDIHLIFIQFDTACICIGGNLSSSEFDSFKEFEIFIKHNDRFVANLTSVNICVSVSVNSPDSVLCFNRSDEYLTSLSLLACHKLLQRCIHPIELFQQALEVLISGRGGYLLHRIPVFSQNKNQ